MIRYPLLKDCASRFPELVVAKDGLATLCIEGRFVHSQYAPKKEALRLIEGVRGHDPAKTFVVFLGAGLGYHIELLESEGFTQGVVVERHPVVAGVFREVYEMPSSLHWIGPQQSEEALDSVFSLIDLSSVRFVKTVVLRGSYDVADYRLFEKRLGRLIEVKLGDFTTRLKFEEIWLVHMIRNLDNLAYSTPVNRLFARRSGVPVLIVSAGPSLRQSLPAIRLAAASMLVVAVDTALLPLYEAGIVPDIVYSLDTQVHTLSDFVGIDREYLGRLHLIYDMVAHPETLPLFRCAHPKRPHYVASTAHADSDPLGNPLLLKSEFVRFVEMMTNVWFGDVETGGSVSTSVFHASFLMGGNPIVLVGQDLSFSYQTTHAASTSHYYRYLPLSNHLRPVNTIFWESILSRRLQKHAGIRSGEVYSDFVLSNFKGWFEVSANRLSMQGIECINATHEGVCLQGFVYRELDEVVRGLKGGLRKEALFVSEPVGVDRVGGVKRVLRQLAGEMRGVPSDRSFFDVLGRLNRDFVSRYYLREKMLFDRYENVDSLAIERKTYRLIKAIEGLRHG